MFSVLDKERICRIILVAALVSSVFFVPGKTRAELALPATSCDSARDLAPHLVDGMTVEDGTKVFAYGLDNNHFALKTGTVVSLNVNLLFTLVPSSSLKIYFMDVNCAIVAGLGFQPEIVPGANVFSYDTDTGKYGINSEPLDQLFTNGSVRYIWAEVVDSYPVAAISSYSYTVDLENIQNPNGTVGTIPQQPEVRLTPDPVIIIPGILGSEQKNGVWTIDPIQHTYDNLLRTLEANGYKKDFDLFTFPYDWHKSNIETAVALRLRIQEVKHLCACDKVDLVAHSMGGLVARQYIQSADYNHDVDQLIFLGTPQLGAPKAYLALEGGELDTSLGDQILKFLLGIEAKKQGVLSLVAYVQGIPSLFQIVPVFDYLKDKNTNLVRTYPQNYPVNSFLEELNQNSNKLFSSGVSIINIVGETTQNSTIRYIRVADPFAPLIWRNGYPEGFLEKIGDRGLERDKGDGTVPLESSEYVFNSTILNSEHSKLPTVAEGQIYRDLTGADPTILSNTFNLPNLKLLIIKMLSPADMMVVVPDGKKIGKDFDTGGEINEISDAFYSGFQNDDEYITIPNPVSGKYKIETQGTGNGGEYTVASGYITDSELLEYDIVKNIQTGEKQNLEITLDIKNPPSLSIGIENPAAQSTSSGGGANGVAGGASRGSVYVMEKTKVKINTLGLIHDSVLILDASDGRTVYIICNNKKYGFTSEQIFVKFGYLFENTILADLSQYELGGLIKSAETLHPDGSLVLNDGTIWYISGGERFGLPSMEIFNSYGFTLNQVVLANTYDLELLEGQPLVSAVIN